MSDDSQESAVVDNDLGRIWQLVEHYIAPLDPLFNDDNITEISVNRYDTIFIDSRSGSSKTDIHFKSEQELQTLIKQIANALGQTCDSILFPRLDARLRDGSRVSCCLPPYAVHGAQMSIRRFPKNSLTEHDLIKSGSFTQLMGEFLKMAVHFQSNILLSGSTGSGKTTLLSILASFVPEKERIITIEDTHEIQLSADNCIQFEAPDRRLLSGQQNTKLPDFIFHSLRNTPDRIVVGEMRNSDAAKAFIEAISTGHPGTISTLHANDCQGALWRLQTLLADKSNKPWEVIERDANENIDIIIQAEKTPCHGRRIVEIQEVNKGSLLPLFSFDFIAGAHVAHYQNLSNSNVFKKAPKYGYDISEIKKSWSFYTEKIE